MGITFVYLFYCQGVTLEKRSLSKKEKNNNGTSGKCSDTIMVEQLLTGAGDEEVVATFSDKEQIKGKNKGKVESKQEQKNVSLNNQDTLEF